MTRNERLEQLASKVFKKYIATGNEKYYKLYQILTWKRWSNVRYQ